MKLDNNNNHKLIVSGETPVNNMESVQLKAPATATSMKIAAIMAAPLQAMPQQANKSNLMISMQLKVPPADARIMNTGALPAKKPVASMQLLPR